MKDSCVATMNHLQDSKGFRHNSVARAELMSPSGYAWVAQSAEYRTFNPVVVGSNPTPGILF